MNAELRNKEKEEKNEHQRRWLVARICKIYIILNLPFTHCSLLIQNVCIWWTRNRDLRA